MPDATGLELLAQDLREAESDAVLDTLYFRDRATLIVDPARVRAALGWLKERGYGFLASVHGVDYYPNEPRLGILYELMDRQRVDQLAEALIRKLHAAQALPAIDPGLHELGILGENSPPTGPPKIRAADAGPDFPTV